LYTTVSSVLLSRHLTDVFAGLMQLAYGPLKIQGEGDAPPLSNIIVGSPVDILKNELDKMSNKELDSRRTMLTAKERDECIQMCDTLLQKYAARFIVVLAFMHQ
jgi:hypothetical protein